MYTVFSTKYFASSVVFILVYKGVLLQFSVQNSAFFSLVPPGSAERCPLRTPPWEGPLDPALLQALVHLQDPCWVQAQDLHLALLMVWWAPARDPHLQDTTYLHRDPQDTHRKICIRCTRWVDAKIIAKMVSFCHDYWLVYDLKCCYWWVRWRLYGVSFDMS